MKSNWIAQIPHRHFQLKPRKEIKIPAKDKAKD
jgi:hypothetical protein